jgi:hypothetical protein
MKKSSEEAAKFAVWVHCNWDKGIIAIYISANDSTVCSESVSCALSTMQVVVGLVGGLRAKVNKYLSNSMCSVCATKCPYPAFFCYFCGIL